MRAEASALYARSRLREDSPAEIQGKRMTPDRWERTKQLFAEVSELPEGERRAFLAREAGDDPELLAELQSLLDWHDHPEPFAEAVPESLATEAFAPEAGRAGDRLGAYRI